MSAATADRYTLVCEGWATDVLVENGTLVETLEAIATLPRPLDQVVMDENYILTLPDGRKLRDRQIAVWLSGRFGEKKA